MSPEAWVFLGVAVTSFAGLIKLGVDLRNSVGKPPDDGQATVIGLLSQLIAGQESQNERLQHLEDGQSALEHGQARHAERIDAVEQRVRHVEEQIGRAS